MKRILKNRLILEFVLIFGLYLFYYAFIKIKFNQQFNLFYFVNDILILLFITQLFRLIKNKKIRFISISLWNTLIYTLFLTNCFLIVFKNDIFSLSMLSQAAAGFGMLGSYNVFKAFNIIEWILNVSVYLSSFYFLYLIQFKYKEVERKPKRNTLALLANFLFICLCFVIAPTSDKELIVNPYYNKVKAFERFGLLTYQVTDTNDFLTKNIPLSDKKIKLIDQHFESKVLPEKDEFYASMQDKNVIMIMLEGIDTYMINEKITPTLYKLISEGHSFPNMYSAYSNIGTYDAEFKALTSSMYYRGDNYYNYYAENYYPTSLANVLSEKGYTTNSFHNYVGEFYNRITMHEALGFENFYSVEEMGYGFEDDIPLWPDDETMFRNMKDKIAPIQDEPFFSFIITVSTHGGYDYHRSYHQKHYDKLANMSEFDDYEPAFINYAAACMDTDEGIRFLLEDLTNKNLLDDTMIIIFGDHKNYSDMEMTLKYKEIDVTNPYLIEKVPFVIYNPELSSQVITKSVSQYDITPTILNLLGIEYYQNYYYGESVYLDKPIKPIILGYNNWFDDKMIVYNDEIIYLDPTIKNPDEYYSIKKEFVYYNIEVYQSIIICDYFNQNKLYSEKILALK